MCNLGALLLALSQEKAVLHDLSLDEVRIRCVITSERGDVMEQKTGMFVEDLYVINAKILLNRGKIFNKSWKINNNFFGNSGITFLYNFIIADDK